MAENALADVPAPEARVAAFAAGLAYDDIPAAVRHEAKRAILNIFATALAGSREPAIDTALGTMTPYSPGGGVSLVGRAERADPLLAAFLNAMAANIFDFDDNHPPTIIHPAAPLAPALFAFAEANPRSGRDVIRAFVLGGEIECRIGNAMSPYHYARGWHITSTCGIFGAAFGVGALLGLDPRQYVWALANAAAQSAGLVETLGTMAKSLSVGNAARQGMMAALLAKDGFSGPAGPLTGERGFLRVYGDPPDISALTDGLGDHWEIATNTYKPYPAGVVLNPVLDACLEVAARPGFQASDVVSIELTGHPLLRQRTDRPNVATGRESQVSAQHAVAIALKRGKAGLDEFTDVAVAETLRDGRPEITFHDDPAMDIAEAVFRATLRDGARLETRVAAARGAPENPLSDAEIEAKLKALAERVGFAQPLGPLIDAVWALDAAEDAGAVSRLAALDPS